LNQNAVATLAHSPLLRFGVFELDSKNGELRKGGSLVRLKPQPLKLLMLLVSQAGDVVARDDIQQQLWGSGTFIDFEQGVNHCIRQIRMALGDDAVHPRYVQTLPRRGYRFLQAPRLPETREALIRPGPDTAERLVLAVLPFENLSGDGREDYLGDGLTDELITQLGRAHPEALGVVSRCSIKGYRDSGKPVAEVGRELGANYIVEGSVRRSVDRVRICAQLVDARHQTQLWAAPYDRTLGDVLSVQCDVGQEIADAIRLALGLTTEGRGGSGPIPQEEPETASASDRTSVFLSWEARPHRRGKAPVVATRVLPEC
jgi:TolB-like protein